MAPTAKYTSMFPSSKWYIIRKIDRLLKYRTRRPEHTDYIDKIRDDLEDIFINNCAGYIFFNQKHYKKLIRKWVSSFLHDYHKSDIKNHNIHGNQLYANYLWHAFSYQLLPCITDKQATLAFDRTNKTSCYLLLNNSSIAYELHHCEKLTADIINQYDDILIFDLDFTWCYCHTHEAYCGPYFYQKTDE